jgi:hypothetical protein
MNPLEKAALEVGQSRGREVSMKYLGLGLVALTAAVFVACAPAAGSASKGVTMGPLGTFATGANSTATGTATITPDGQKTRVVVSLAGLTANTKHAGHIHAGSCSAQGPVVVPLGDIASNASGAGSSSTDVDTAKLSGSLYIAYHQRDATDTQGIGGVIACGDIK